jgi:hypothetical protein
MQGLLAWASPISRKTHDDLDFWHAVRYRPKNVEEKRLSTDILAV